MSTPHPTVTLGGELLRSAVAADTLTSGPHVKHAPSRTSGDPSPSSPTSSPDALMASPSSSLAMLTMLPTPPASLPTRVAHFEHDPPARAGESPPAAYAEGHELGVDLPAAPAAEWRDATPPFALEDLAGPEGDNLIVAMDLEGVPGTDSLTLGSTNVPLTAVAPFSAAAPIHRPFRSRYASSSTDSLALDTAPSDFADHPEDDVGLSHKRSHADVLPSTGNTPPASFGDTLTRPTSLFSPPESADDHVVSPRWRRSFSYDAQRAEPTTSVVSATATAAAPLSHAAPSSSLGLLRRRARAPTEPDSTSAFSHSVSSLSPRVGNSGQSKRRRSGTLSVSDTSAADNSLAHGPSTSRPATTDDDVATIRRRGRLSLACFPSAAITSVDAEPALSVRPTAPPSTSSSQQTQQAYDALLVHAARSDALATRGEGLLREAAGVLARAEEEVSRAAALVGARDADRERQRERDVAQRLPSTDGLRDPREAGERPVIGIRLGGGWPQMQTHGSPPAPVSPPPPSEGRRRRPSLWSLSSSSGPSSPPASWDPQSPPLEGSASSRARNFITQLRARRPRLSRNSTAVSPPESGLASPPSFSRASTFGSQSGTSGSPSSSAAALRSWTLPSPPLAATLAGSAFDESAELAAANGLNMRLLERRRVSESLDLGVPPPPAEQLHPPPDTSLWGETSGSAGGSGIARRLRGPTQVANERRRFGQLETEPPFPLAGASTATTTATASTARLSTPSWRRFSRPSSVDTRGSPSSTRAGDAHFFDRVRDDSPSPRRERIGSTAALDAAEEGASPPRWPMRGIGRPAIRLPRPESVAERSSSRLRLMFEDDANEERSGAANGAAWAAPATLPLMLPSGSDGARMLFPHPAAAAGPTDGGAAASSMERQRSASPFGQFGPDHLFHDESSFSVRRTVPWNEVPASAYSSRRAPPRFDPWADQPSTSTTTANANAVPLAERISPRRSSLTDALSSFGTRSTSDGDLGEASLRRRRGVPQQADASGATPEVDQPFLERRRALDAFRYGDETVEERLAQHRQSRMERLQALRRERHVMRTLLGGGGGGSGSPASPPIVTAAAVAVADDGATPNPNPWAPPAPREPASPPLASRSRSPGARGRGLGDFLRGLSGAGGRYGFGGRGGLIGIWDDDLTGFLTRDSAALDPRNYLDDDEFDTSYEALIRLSERLGDAKPKGVSPETLASLRRFKYAEWPLPTPSSSSSSSSSPPDGAPVASTSTQSLELDKETRCGICLCDYEDDDECVLTRCTHLFHRECAEAWLKQKGTCPVCRRDHVGA